MNVAVADDHPIVVLAICEALAAMPSLNVVATAPTGTELLRVAESGAVQLIVTDLVMHSKDPDDDGLKLVQRLRRQRPDVRIVVFTMTTNRGVLHQLCRIGVSAIVGKDEDVRLLARVCMRALVEKETILSSTIMRSLSMAGKTQRDLRRAQPLSPRETEVVRLIANGMSLTEIARKLNRSKATVATQKYSAMRKLHFDNGADLVRFASEFGLS
ncbi:response regulator [Paraburkholderia phymatum]|uniref:Response regulator n=1 Tax=Paraburkholderia phymatum TaxID=148447 RepID=A0ACC6U3L8_9BURK